MDINIKNEFSKQGGCSLIKQYINNKVLFLALFEYLFLDKNRTSLELLRLSVQEKIHYRIEKRFIKELITFDENYIENEHLTSNIVWICWFQGIENAPKIVKFCYQSVKDNLVGKEIKLITKDNIYNYVEFPNYIKEKWEMGIISDAHMSDLLRLELLDKYGGLWLDATVLCSNTINNIPRYIFDSYLFLYQQLKPGRDGSCIYISSWLISSKTNNKIIKGTKYLLYKYWKNNDKLIDYFLLHHFMSIVLEYYNNEWKKIIPVDNSTCHILQLRQFDKYDERIWQSIKDQTPFHKLTYKNNKAIEDDSFIGTIMTNK